MEHTRLIVVEEAVLEAGSLGASQPVFGLVRDGLVQVLSARPLESLVPVGTVEAEASAGRVITIACSARSLRLALAPGLPEPADVQVVAVDEALDSRRVGVRPSGIEGKRALCIGTGSVGSLMALLLAQAGVRRFDLIDDDTLEAHNLSRHICDLRDLGRIKVEAVADALRFRRAEAGAIRADFCALPETERRELVERAGVVVATTDSNEAQFLANEDCIATGTPGLFVGAYERACGGEIVVVRPGAGPCLFCCVGFRVGIADGVSVKERRQAYQEADAQRLIAEPGLGVDIAFLASVASAYALALLDPSGSRGELLTRSSGFTLLHAGSTPRDAYADLFHGPVDFVEARVMRDEPCPVCGWRSA